MRDNMTLKVINNLLKLINNTLDIGDIPTAKECIDANDQPFKISREQEKQEDIDEFKKMVMEFNELKSKLNDKMVSRFEGNINNIHSILINNK